MQAAVPAHAINLRNGLIAAKPLFNLLQTRGLRLDFKIAGNRSADFLRVNNRGILFNNPLFFQRVNTGFHGHARDAGFFPDLGIAIAGVFNQQG